MGDKVVNKDQEIGCLKAENERLNNKIQKLLNIIESGETDLCSRIFVTSYLKETIDKKITETF